MAERSGELVEKTPEDETNDDLALTKDVTGDNFLTEYSPENYSGSEEPDAVETSGDAEQLRASIEETRAGMSETIDAIQEKLSFNNISEQVKDEVSDYVNETIQKAKHTIIDVSVKKVGNFMKYANKGMNEIGNTKIIKSLSGNPMALALIGLGVGVLLVNGLQKKKPNHGSRRSFRYDRENQGGERDYSSKNKKSILSTAQDKVSSAAGVVGESVSSAAGKVSETVSGAAGKVSETVSGAAGKAYEQVGNFGSQAQEFAGTAQEQYKYYMDENPLAVGAVALALGAAVGLSLPSTRVENQFMGETRDNLLQQAQDTARDAVDTVQQVAGQVTEQFAGQVSKTASAETKK